MALGSSPGNGPYIGQIVIATNAPNTTVSGTTISGNIIDGSLLPGIVVHANTPGSMISNSIIENNLISNNGFNPPTYATPNTPVSSNGTTGIALEAEAAPGMPTPPTITGTSITSNTIIGDRNAVWTCNTSGTAVTQLLGNASVPVLDCHTGPTSLTTTSMMTGAAATSTIPTLAVQSSFLSELEALVAGLFVVVIVLGIVVMRTRRKKT